MPELWHDLQANLPGLVGHLTAVGIILLVGWIFYRYCVDPLRRLLVRIGVSPGVVSFLLNFSRALLLIAVILSVLRQIGVETTSLALLGAGSATVILSLRGFLGNFAGGLVLLSQHMMRLGDTIETGDVRGQVVEMQVLHVVVETAERIRITIPNTLLVNAPFRNHSALPTRRLQWLLPLPLGIDLAPVKEELIACLLADARVLREPAPEVFLRDRALDKQTLAVQAWTATVDAPAVQDQMLEPMSKLLSARVQAMAEKKPVTN